MTKDIRQSIEALNEMLDFDYWFRLREKEYDKMVKTKPKGAKSEKV